MVRRESHLLDSMLVSHDTGRMLPLRDEPR
jgi:hypothetical protein